MSLVKQHLQKKNENILSPGEVHILITVFFFYYLEHRVICVETKNTFGMIRKACQTSLSRLTRIY